LQNFQVIPKNLSSLKTITANVFPEKPNFPTLRIAICKDKKFKKFYIARAIFDTGSSINFCENGLIDKMGAKCEYRTLDFSTLGGDVTSERKFINVYVADAREAIEKPAGAPLESILNFQFYGVADNSFNPIPPIPPRYLDVFKELSDDRVIYEDIDSTSQVSLLFGINSAEKILIFNSRPITFLKGYMLIPGWHDQNFWSFLGENNSMLCGKDNVNLNLTREIVNVVANPPEGVGVKRAIKVSALDDVLVDVVDPTPLPSLRKKKIPARSDLAANVPLFDETGKAEVFGLDDNCQRSGTKFERESFIRFITALSKWFTLHCESPIDSKDKISVGLKSARDFFNKNVQLKDRRLIVGTFWNDVPKTWLSNYENALQRAIRTEKGLERNIKRKHNYQAGFQELIKLGILQYVPKPDIHSGRYLAHFPVYRSPRDFSPRIVFDAAAVDQENVCWNDAIQYCLNDNLNLLTIICINFRKSRYIVTLDVKKFYLQIFRKEEDWSYQKVLYRSSTDEPFHTYVITRVFFGASDSQGVTSEAVRHLATKFKEQFPEAAEEINRSLYVDDLSLGSDCEEILLNRFIQVKSLLELGSLELGKCQTNSRVCYEYAQKHGMTSDKAYLAFVLPHELHETDKFKFLGLKVSPDFRFLSCHFCEKLVDKKEEFLKKPTVRRLCSLIATCWDSLGLFCPPLVEGKLILSSARVHLLKI